VSLTSGRDRRSPSTIRGYHLSLRMFGDYVTDARYEWPRVCRLFRLKRATCFSRLRPA
jgi:hypothetical protein